LKSQKSEITILLQQCKENNQKAQLALYNLYCSAMFNVAFRIVSDKTLAEEIMQDSFLKAFTKLDSYSGKVTFGAWLKKIVINTSINELKKVNPFQFERLNETNESTDINEEDSISWNELKATQILKTMQSLKSNYKIILTLFFIEGFDLEEISSILNISNENCRTTMSRAKESLRKKLNENGK
jgi:RNA polymerase sigma factor (sigma-70 family)